MKTFHKVIIGDSRKMTEIRDESVHLVITSPPYWQLKDYGNKGQIGFHDVYEDYINNLNLVWNECRRILHDGCRLCINIGDQFARSVYYGRYKVIPIRTEITKFCESAGFDYMGAVIWQKVTTCNTTGGATVMGSFPYPRNGVIKIDYEFVLIFKKHGSPPKVSKDIKEQSKLSREEWNTYFTGHWNFAGEKQDQHLAMFPEELPRRLIKMFSFVGDTIADPFLGSGTTSRAAKNLHRHSIGYEINEHYLTIIKEKLGHTHGAQSEEIIIDIVTQKDRMNNFEEEINKLPYVFRDPIRFDKKVDPARLQFGSKIDASSPERELYYTVKEIISPEIFILNNGLKIRLLGVKEKSEKNGEALQFLQTLLRGKKVYIECDHMKYDENNNLLCYLYLKNKTFINAHLIRKGLVGVDTAREYAYKSKFLSAKPVSPHHTKHAE